MNFKGAKPGNKNAQRGQHPRIQITIRLPSDLIEKLRAGGSVTAQIESAIRKHIESG